MRDQKVGVEQHVDIDFGPRDTFPVAFLDGGQRVLRVLAAPDAAVRLQANCAAVHGLEKRVGVRRERHPIRSPLSGSNRCTRSTSRATSSRSPIWPPKLAGAMTRIAQEPTRTSTTCSRPIGSTTYTSPLRWPWPAGSIDTSSGRIPNVARAGALAARAARLLSGRSIVRPSETATREPSLWVISTGRKFMGGLPMNSATK